MNDMRNRINQYKLKQNKELWDSLWRTINSAILKLNPSILKTYYTPSNQNAIQAYHIMFDQTKDYSKFDWNSIQNDDIDHLYLYKQLFRAQFLCESYSLETYQLQLAKQSLIRDIFQKNILTSFWYLLEAILLLTELHLAKNEQSNFSIPHYSYIHRSVTPKKLTNLLPPSCSINYQQTIHQRSYQKDYSQEKLANSRLKLSEFETMSKQSNHQNDIKTSYPQKNPKTTSDMKFPIDKKPKNFLRNYYLSILMQQKPPVNHSKLKIDMSKITFDQDHKTQKGRKHTLIIINRDDVVEEESFGSDQQEEYQQCLQDIEEEYQIPQINFVTNRTITKICLTPHAIDRIRGEKNEKLEAEDSPLLLSLLEQPLIKQQSTQSQKSQKSQKSIHSVTSQKSALSKRSQKSLNSQKSLKSHVSQRSQKSQKSQNTRQSSNYFLTQCVSLPVNEKYQIPLMQDDSQVIQEQTLEHEQETPKLQNQKTQEFKIQILPTSPQLESQKTIPPPPNKVYSKKFQEMHRKLQMIFGIAKSEKVDEEPIQDGLLNYERVQVRNVKPRSKGAI